MARNYMQDITPAGEEPEEIRPRRRAPAREKESELEPEPETRSIRDIRPSQARARLASRPPEIRDEYDTSHTHAIHTPALRPKSRTRLGIWAAAALALVVVGGAGFLMVFASTTVTVIPHTQTITFDASSPFTAYPKAGAGPGTIAYTVMTQVFEDSATVQASGTEHAEEKATGNITVYNEYSEEPVALIKNTRFQTPNGLIFRIPASVDVPGKRGDSPGSIEVTAFADQNGPSYNIGPIDRLTIPGLKSSPDMYAKVYAKSGAAFSGGFSGDRPAVSPSVLESSRAEVRNRLNEKAQEFVRTASGIAFPGLMLVSFETLPPTEEGGGSVRINERATVSLPVFPDDRFAQSVGQAVSANAEGQSVSIRLSDGIVAGPVQPLASADLGTQPIVFTLNGRGQLVWNVDGSALSDALAGREEGAFQTIIGGFPAIEEARARIMPFWKSSFPPNAADIKIATEEPAQEF